MKIPLQLNGEVLGKIDNDSSDLHVLSKVKVKIVRVPGKLIDIHVNVIGFEKTTKTLRL